MYYWIAYLWRWTAIEGCRHAPFLMIWAKQEDLEEWMVHPGDAPCRLVGSIGD